MSHYPYSAFGRLPFPRHDHIMYFMEYIYIRWEMRLHENLVGLNGMTYGDVALWVAKDGWKLTNEERLALDDECLEPTSRAGALWV